MRRLTLVILTAVLLIPLVVNGQQRDCGNGLPCGPLPWPLPRLPYLVSPTPMPTISITGIPTATVAPTATGAPTSTPAPTGTVMSDFTSLGDQLATLGAAINATAIPVEVSGTPIDPNEQLEDSAEGALTFFSYVRGFASVDLGGLTMLIAFVITTFVTVIAVKAITFALPLITAIFGLVFQGIQFFISIFKG